MVVTVTAFHSRAHTVSPPLFAIAPDDAPSPPDDDPSSSDDGLDPADDPAERVRIGRYGTGAVGIVALHGWAGTHRSFVPLAPHLIGPQCALLAPDLPGCGGSADPISWTVDGITDELLAALDPQLDRPVVLVGACSGAAFAVRLADRLGAERVRALVLVEPFAYLPWYFRIFTWPLLGWVFYTGTFASPIGRAVVDGRLRASGNSPPGAPAMTRAFETVNHRATRRYLKLLAREVRERPLESTPPPPGVPVTMLVGTRTFGAVRESVKRLQAAWTATESTVVDVPDGGHMLLQDQPRRVAALIHAITERAVHSPTDGE